MNDDVEWWWNVYTRKCERGAKAIWNTENSFLLTALSGNGVWGYYFGWLGRVLEGCYGIVGYLGSLGRLIVFFKDE